MYLALRRNLCKARIQKMEAKGAREEAFAIEQKVIDKIKKFKGAGEYGSEISERINCICHDA